MDTLYTVPALLQRLTSKTFYLEYTWLSGWSLSQLTLGLEGTTSSALKEVSCLWPTHSTPAVLKPGFKSNGDLIARSTRLHSKSSFTFLAYAQSLCLPVGGMFTPSPVISCVHHHCDDQWSPKFSRSRTGVTLVSSGPHKTAQWLISNNIFTDWIFSWLCFVLSSLNFCG